MTTSVQTDQVASALDDFITGVTTEAQLSAALYDAGIGLDPALVQKIDDLRATMQMRMLFGAESDLAAASTTSLVNAQTSVIRITGASTTINSFGAVPDMTKGGSSIRFVRFLNSQTIAAGVLAAGTLVAPAGSTMVLQALSGTSWLLRDHVDPSGNTYISKVATALQTMAGPLALPGVKFAATQVASADPNTLDDYQEGTFTAGVTFNNANAGIAYASNSGTYTKIGNRVFFELTINLSDKGSSTGQVRVTGLPESVALAETAVSVLGSFGGLAAGRVPMGYIQPGTTQVVLYALNAGTLVGMVDTDLANNSFIILSGHYKV